MRNSSVVGYKVGQNLHPKFEKKSHFEAEKIDGFAITFTYFCQKSQKGSPNKVKFKAEHCG